MDACILFSSIHTWSTYVWIGVQTSFLDKPTIRWLKKNTKSCIYNEGATSPDRSAIWHPRVPKSLKESRITAPAACRERFIPFSSKTYLGSSRTMLLKWNWVGRPFFWAKELPYNTKVTGYFFCIFCMHDKGHAGGNGCDYEPAAGAILQHGAQIRLPVERHPTATECVSLVTWE